MGFEKILMLIEKMSVSEGLRRMKDKRIEDKIKTIGVAEKIDLMALFRRKYQPYFTLREKETTLTRSLKVGNSAFKNLIALDQQSVSPFKPNTSSQIVTFGTRKKSRTGGNTTARAGSTLTQSIGNKTDLFSLVLGNNPQI